MGGEKGRKGGGVGRLPRESLSSFYFFSSRGGRFFLSLFHSASSVWWAAAVLREKGETRRMKGGAEKESETDSNCRTRGQHPTVCVVRSSTSQGYQQISWVLGKSRRRSSTFKTPPGRVAQILFRIKKREREQLNSPLSFSLRPFIIALLSLFN